MSCRHLSQFRARIIMALFLLFACQAACLMKCMEGGNDASRIEVLKLIMLSYLVFFG